MRRRSKEYDAFRSYAHRDRQVTVAIQKGLHRIGRRLCQLRALRVFRDDTNLIASPDLWARSPRRCTAPPVTGDFASFRSIKPYDTTGTITPVYGRKSHD